MDNKLKFYLLAELSGWNCTKNIIGFKDKIKEKDSYKTLTYNIDEARKHLSTKAQSLTLAYDNLRLEPFSIKEAFLIENTLNYMALHSYPEYYLNPLAIDPNYQGEVNTIGDLVFDSGGKDITLNELIKDKTTSMADKKLDINRQLDYYLLDMNKIVNSSIETINSRGFSQRNRGKDVFYRLIEVFLFIAINFLLGMLYIFPYDPFKEIIYNPSYNLLMTYVMFIYPIFVGLYDFTFVLFHTYKAKITEPYNYARRFLRNNKDKVYSDIKRERDVLYNYITEALENEIILKNDIRDFSKLSSSYIDFAAVLNVANLKNKKTYKTYRRLYLFFLTLTFIMALISAIAFMVSIAFNTIV